MIINKWTTMIKAMRSKSGYSLRVAAKGLNISAPYLFDVEAGKRPPTRKLVSSIISLYNLDEEAKKILFDAAAEANDSIPYDVEDFLKSNPEAIPEVRKMMIKERKDKKIKR